MKKLLMIGAAVFAFSTAAHANETILIEDFIGQVEVKTSNTSNIEITKKRRSGDVDFDASAEGLSITGPFDEPDDRQCRGYYGRFSVSWFGRDKEEGSFGGFEDLEDYPEIEISAPDDVEIVVRNSILFGSFGDVGSVDVNVDSCGDLIFGNVAGEARIKSSGSTDVSTKDVASVDARTSGSGDLTFGNIGSGEIRTSGSGDIDIENAEKIIITTSGSGDIDLEDVSGSAEIKTSGSGDASIGTVDGGLIFSSSGSGDLDADEINTRLELRLSGSGDADIDDGNLDYLKIYAAGSSDVDFDGTTETADLSASGSSDIYVDRVTGSAQTEESRSADIKIGHRE